MRSELKSELIQVLNIFQEGYIKRDLKEIDSFMETLFDKNEDIVVIGTSNGECCLNYEEVKDLFLGDWEYWGDLRINIAEASIMPLEDTALIYVPATVKYTFCSNNDTYSRYLGYVKQYFSEGTEDYKKPDKVKLTEINWKLSHLLSQRDSNERAYLWDLRISFLLIKKETRWIIRQIQFSLPVVGYLPDVRIDNICFHEEDHKVELNKMKEYSANKKSVYSKEIEKLLQEFSKEYLNKDKDISEVASKYFTINNPFISDIDKNLCNNHDEIKDLIKKHRAYYDEINLNYENCIINSSKDVVWILANGIMRKNMDEENAFENTIDIINDIFSSALDDRDKLFNIRRRISDTLKENAKGEKYVWPFRLEGVLIKDKEGWVFKYAQFSLPFNYIFEGKTEAATILENTI